MKNLKQFADILSLGNQYQKKEYLQSIFSEYQTIEDEYGNFYVSRDFSKIQPFVCSHIDTVAESDDSKTIIYDSVSSILTAERNGKQCNLGADDGVGIWACVSIFKDYDVGLAFFLDEEVGCLGSASADPNILKNASYLIQLDRKGNEDIVFKTSFVDIASDSFIKDINPIIAKHGYSSAIGGMTDVVTLVERNIVSVAACNISCGYYNPHKKDEYIIIKDMLKAISLAKDIISSLGNVVYEHVFEDNYFDFECDDYYLNNFQNGTMTLKSYLMELAQSDLDDDTIIEKIYTEILC